MTTATEMMNRSLRIDLRRNRAMQIVARLMQIADPHLDRDADRRALYDEFADMVFNEGWEVITDKMRAEAGLPPRDEMGWTDADLRAYEIALINVMTRPTVVSINPASTEPLDRLLLQGMIDKHS